MVVPQLATIFVWCGGVLACSFCPQAVSAQSCGHEETSFPPIFDTDDMVLFQRTGLLQQNVQRQLGMAYVAPREALPAQDFQEDVFGLLQHDASATHRSNTTSAATLQHNASLTRLTNASFDVMRASEADVQQGLDIDGDPQTQRMITQASGLGFEYIATATFPVDMPEADAFGASQAPRLYLDMMAAAATTNASFELGHVVEPMAQAFQQKQDRDLQAQNAFADVSSQLSAPSPPAVSHLSRGSHDEPSSRHKRPRASLALVRLSAQIARIGSLPSCSFVFLFCFSMLAISYALLSPQATADQNIRASDHDVLTPVIFHDACSKSFVPPAFRAAPVVQAWQPSSVFTRGRGGNPAEPIRPQPQAALVPPNMVRVLLPEHAAPLAPPPLHSAYRPL